MCPNKEYISSPGAQVNKLKRMESLLLADACPADGSNRKKERSVYKKTVSLAGSFYFGDKFKYKSRFICQLNKEKFFSLEERFEK